jgi:hypothetical protein
MEGSVARADRVKRLQQLIDEQGYLVSVADIDSVILWGAAKCLSLISKKCPEKLTLWIRLKTSLIFDIGDRVFILDILLAHGLQNMRPGLLKDLWDYHSYSSPALLAMSARLIDWGYPPLPRTLRWVIPIAHSTTTIDYNNRIAAFKLRKTSCIVLLRVLWSKGMPKDVARLVARDPVLWTKSAWREWPCN